ncbi:short-chain dehydrogenase/reductase SDR [Staphylotrichum tortipilum]|uniref:Short-chain dehydrogenase/reductase SDR n=1 Tax=Staphylotrichum tortipilum TaxID=2831512 RepID=A0AAN6RN89_9PEZI|nr:short-chain dehydrogenase/reductase SDR [Staphylotrichum longicolle]
MRCFINHASLPRFSYHQITFKPQAVHGVGLLGKTAIITGSNTGVGFETARQLLHLGLNKLTLAVRSEEKGRVAATTLSPSDVNRVEVWHLDLREYDSVTGHDETIQVNYLSTTLLAILLLPVVKAARANQLAPTRITFTSSEGAAWAKFNLSQETPILAALDKEEQGVDTVDRMFVSKLLGQLFLNELAKRLPPSVAVINPASAGSIIMRRVANTAVVGARMMTDAILNHGEQAHGQFLSFQPLVPTAPIIYAAEGEKVTKQLWKEMLEELAFVCPEDILQAVRA